MMKKNLLILAVAAAALASCSSDEVVSKNTSLTGNDIQQKEISFFALSRPTTRSAEYNAVEGTVFPENYDMKVVAYSVPETGTPGNYFGNTDSDGGILFKYNYKGGTTGGTNNYWGGVPAQYWPLSPATLNFLAISKSGSPTADVVSPQFNANYASGVTVTLSDNKPQTASTGTGQHDLMYAFGRAQVTQTGNALSFPDKVDMTFNHALAWVVFRVKAGNSSSAGITIKEIRLNGAKYAGTFQAEVNNYNKTDGGGTLSWNTSNTKWTAASASADNIPSPNMTLDADGDGNSTNDSKSISSGSWTQIGDGIMVVPTSELTSTSSIASFDIDYYLNGNLYTYHYTPAELTFDKGKKYIYDITMTLHEIFINPSVESWQDGGTEYVDIPTFTAGTTGRTFDIPATAGTYIFRVAGFTGADTPVVSGTLTTTITTATVTVSDYTGGVATVKVTVPANESGTTKGGTIILTDTGTSASAANNTTVTVTQAL